MSKFSAGGGQLIAFNYPLLEVEEQKVCEKFFNDCLKSEDNLYYYPKPNEYVEVDDFAFFCLKKDLTLDNYYIESLYRNNLLDVSLRNKIHPLLRKTLGIDSKVYKKVIFKESRKLFNLSYSFKPYDINKDVLTRDLTKNLRYFYKAPETIGIQLNNTCNLSCIMCHYHSPVYKPTQSTEFFKIPMKLDSQVVKDAILYASKNGCVVDFTGPGEVLLDDRIYDFIKFARDSGVKRVGFTSNATLLTKDRSKKLIDSGISYIRFSIDGANEKTYKEIRGASLKKVEENVREFIRYAQVSRSNVEINLNCVLVESKGVKNEMGLFMEKWKEYLPYINYVNFSNEMFLDEKGFHKEKMPENRYVCHWPFFNGMYIAPNGKVSICCAMQATYGRSEVSVGDVYKDTLEEIWNGKTLNALRKECLTQKYEKFKICQSCIEWANNRMEDDGSGRNNGIVHRK
ncbi:radical SAM/SPASM domain-containing protein [Helicobacter ibis]|uniref:Radical SAM protein n=1 Tax=Helicobacter ibis TaxID=2962633 RepID=A0ABT4VEJ4_9HELI|nr:radical SAM protein [Helicobacter ibis]MDA3969129.1 radical SAM protein [Helicobacter ibis]